MILLEMPRRRNNLFVICIITVEWNWEILTFFNEQIKRFQVNPHENISIDFVCTTHSCLGM